MQWETMCEIVVLQSFCTAKRFLHVPLQPVTKVLAASTVVMAIATQMGILSIPRVVFLPAKIVLEPWRLYTSYCYFGSLDFQLIQRIFMVSQTNDTLERAYVMKLRNLPRRWYHGLDEGALLQSFEHNKPWDFAYFLFRLTVSIVACVMVANRWFDVAKHYFILGPTMKTVLLYIMCRNMPEDGILFLGIQIKAKYAPFIENLVLLLLSREFQVLTSARKDFMKAILQFSRSELVIRTIFEFLMGHLWWYIEFVYLSRTASQSRWEEACAGVEPRLFFGQFDVANFWRYVITPPWYFWLTKMMRHQQARGAAFVDEREDNGRVSESETGPESEDEQDSYVAGAGTEEVLSEPLRESQIGPATTGFRRNTEIEREPVEFGRGESATVESAEIESADADEVLQEQEIPLDEIASAEFNGASSACFEPTILERIIETATREDNLGAQNADAAEFASQNEDLHIEPESWALRGTSPTDYT